MNERLDLVFIGLSLSSSWGNGHATTYRALLRGLRRFGHRLTFLERDVPWYSRHRDLAAPDFCRLKLYRDPADLEGPFRTLIANADAVIVGSYVPDGVAVLDSVLAMARGPVAFYDIDTPVTLSKLDEGEAEYLVPRQVPEVDLYFSFAGGSSLDRLRNRFGAREAVALYCMVDPELYAPTGEEPRWELGYLGTYSADRQEALEQMLLEPARRLPDRRFVVAGPQYPHTIAWPANVERIDHVPPAEHPSFYSRLRFALNLTRADMRAAGWAPRVRLFEAAACGTAIISDDWDGLDSFFPVGEA
jgi:spore maturation protein CgeB